MIILNFNSWTNYINLVSKQGAQMAMIQRMVHRVLDWYDKYFKS